MVICRTVQFMDAINKHKSALQIWISNSAIQKQTSNSEGPFLTWVTREIRVVEA